MAIQKGTQLNYEIIFKPSITIAQRVLGKAGLISTGTMIYNSGSGVNVAWTEKGRCQVNVNGYRDTNQLAKALASAVASIGFPATYVRVWI